MPLDPAILSHGEFAGKMSVSLEMGFLTRYWVIYTICLYWEDTIYFSKTQIRVGFLAYSPHTPGAGCGWLSHLFCVVGLPSCSLLLTEPAATHYPCAWRQDSPCRGTHSGRVPGPLLPVLLLELRCLTWLLFPGPTAVSNTLPCPEQSNRQPRELTGQHPW